MRQKCIELTCSSVETSHEVQHTHIQHSLRNQVSGFHSGLHVRSSGVSLFALLQNLP